MTMKLKNLRLLFVIGLLGVVSLTLAGCEDFAQFVPTETQEEAPKNETSATSIRTEDNAVMAVYEYLLAKAESPEAKVYLADFFTVSDNWQGESEFLGDGTTIWRVSVDMTDTEVWNWTLYWRQAEWVVFQDGKVVPSSSFESNALRIEADLQKQSAQAGS